MSRSPSVRPNRRQALRTAATAGLAVAGASALSAPNARAQEDSAPPEDYRTQHGRIRQSVMAWCFNPMPMETLIPACAKMGLAAMEGIGEEFYPLMKEHGLAVSLCSSHGFARGPVNPDNHAFCVEQLRAGIDRAVEWGSPSVITFTGMREAGISDEAATKNCVACWKQVIGYAEEKGINLVLEHLNSRDDTHQMKGHPGYFGDDVDQCVDLIRLVDSPRMKLLFDIYHVQIMIGDVIRRIRQYKDVIGHYHTAGVPGRGELDDTQELHYSPIMRAILETDYTGYVAQEFIPTWEDKLASLRHGVRVCDV